MRKPKTCSLKEILAVVNCNHITRTGNEDLKAAQGIVAIPAEEHPQHQMKNELCEEILLLIKEMESMNLQYSDDVKRHSCKYRNKMKIRLKL